MTRKDRNVSCSLQSGNEQIFYRQISFTRVVAKNEHAFSRRYFRQFLCECRKRGSRRNTHKYTFLACTAPGHLKRRFFAHRYRAIEDLRVEYGRNKTSANSLDAMKTFFLAGDNLRFFRLHCEHLQVGKFCLEHFSTTRDMTTGTDPGDEVVDTIREVSKNLLRGRFAMNCHICGIVELHGHPAVGMFLH